MNVAAAKSLVSTPDTEAGINMILGLFIIVSPYLLFFRDLLPAVLNNAAVGILVAVCSGIRVSIGYNQPGWSWCTALGGLWLVISPFALGFINTTAMWSNIVVGVVVALLSWRAARTSGAQTATTSQT